MDQEANGVSRGRGPLVGVATTGARKGSLSSSVALGRWATLTQQQRWIKARSAGLAESEKGGRRRDSEQGEEDVMWWVGLSAYLG